MSLFNAIQNSSQPFVHKRLGRAIVGFATGGPVGAAAGFATGGGGGARPVLGGCPLPPGDLQFQIRRWQSGASRSPALRAELEACGVNLRGLVSSDRCPPLMRPHPVTGECTFFIGDRPGRDTRPLETGPGVPVGNAVMGRYGAALEPGSMIVDRAVCLRGMHLADDGLCYNKGAITNKQRAWPRGRKPLLTGGEMRAISVASTAAKRLTRTAVRLQEIGLIKKPVTRKPPKKKAC